jgi:NitT/TauT family transport system substrate-binding protein
VIDRRDFLRVASSSTAAALFSARVAPAVPALSTDATKVRIIESGEICTGTPLIVAADLLRSEPGVKVDVMKKATGVEGFKAVAAGEADVTISAVPSLLVRIDAGDPLLLMGGVHVGCFELFGNDKIRSLRDLKGKSVAVTSLGSGRHVFLASMLAHGGLDPNRDVQWVTEPAAKSIKLFADGKIDAFMGFPPEPQELRAKGIGRVVVDTKADKPWSQYLCCVAVANRDFVRKNPAAAKSALRAILKASSMCALDPDGVSRLRVSKGYRAAEAFARQAIKELPYGVWRDYHPEDSARFYALRLNEAGLIKSSPQRVIAQGVDGRFLEEIKKELKG